MPFWGDLDHLMQAVDYRKVLPFAARLPLPLGEGLSIFRGSLQAFLDYDWRSMALGQRYVRANTYKAMNAVA
jgi:hypothetical protein